MATVKTLTAFNKHRPAPDPAVLPRRNETCFIPVQLIHTVAHSDSPKLKKPRYLSEGERVGSGVLIQGVLFNSKMEHTDVIHSSIDESQPVILNGM